MKIGNRNIIFKSTPALFMTLVMLLLTSAAVELVVPEFAELWMRSITGSLLILSVIGAMFWMTWDVAKDIFKVTKVKNKLDVDL